MEAQSESPLQRVSAIVGKGIDAARALIQNICGPTVTIDAEYVEWTEPAEDDGPMVMSY